MSAVHRLVMRARAFWKAVRSQTGAFDLPSIITGVVVVGILAAGVLAAIFGVIPWSQDGAAKQDLDSVRTAEGVAKTTLGGYKDKDGLLGAGLLGDAATIGVGTDATGSCYVGISKSATGKVYFNSDRTTQPEPLTDGMDTGCIDAAAQDNMVDTIGGFGPSPVAGGSTDTDGDGIPDASDPDIDGDGIPNGEDPTPNGEAGGGGGTLLASSWSPKRTLTNAYPDPGFKNNVAGWTGDNLIGMSPQAVALTTIDYSMQGYDGDAGALKISTTAGPENTVSGGTSAAYYPIDLVNPNYASFQITTPDGTWHENASWYFGFAYTDKVTGAFISSQSAGNATRVGGLGANVWERIEGSHYYGAPAQAHNTYLMIQADHVPAGRSVTMLVDRVYVSSGGEAPWSPSVANYQRNFDGSYPSSADFTYSWTGAANASPSTAVAPKAIAAPATANVGDTIQIKGEGFVPGSTVTPAVFLQGSPGGAEDFYAAPVQADSSGNFDTTMVIPETTRPWNWKIGVVEDTSYPRVLPIVINAKPGTGPSAATAPGQWSTLASTTEQISAPAVVTLGSAFTVLGKGYTPFTQVYVYIGDWDYYVQAYTDNTGYFTAPMNIPSGKAAPGPGVITADGREDISLNVTFQ